MHRLNRHWCIVLTYIVFLLCESAMGDTWSVSGKIALGTNVVRVLADPSRTCVYAIDRANSNILFIDPVEQSVLKKLYVGKDPTDFDIDTTGDRLFVANKGPGTGAPGSDRIAIVDLNSQTMLTSYVVPVRAVNVTAGREGRLYYNAGYDLWNSGDAHALNASTGDDLGSFAGVKSRMVISSNKTRLYGQYIYYGNLGQMGVWDVSGDQITLVDSLGYSPYPYGWDYDNYSLSGNDRYLAYGLVLFNATNLSDQIGLFQEQVYALNYDGSIAFGATAIWDTTTFMIHGDATKIVDLPFTTTIMSFDNHSGVLYAFNSADNSLYVIEQATTHGISHRWLARYSLDTNDTVETQDLDNDGFTTLQEWTLNSNPTNSTPPLNIEALSGIRLTVSNTSSARWYELQRTDDLVSGNWEPISETQGSGSNLLIDLTKDMSLRPLGFYRLRAKIY